MIFSSKKDFSRISWKNLLTLLSTNFLGNNTYNGFFQENWKFAIHGKLTFWMEKPYNLQNFLTLRNLLILFELSFKHILTGIHTFFFITNFCCFFQPLTDKSTPHVLFILISNQLMLSYNSSSPLTQYFIITENNGGRLQKIEENSSIENFLKDAKSYL